MNAGATKAGIFLLVIVALAWGMSGILANRGLGRPRESMRVRHTAGFSIVVPDTWGYDLEPSSDLKAGRILATPEANRGFTQSMTTLVLPDPPPPLNPKGKPKAWTFQGEPAMLGQFAKDHREVYQIQFQRAGRWFQIELRTRNELPNWGGEWRPFLESFRVEPVTKLATPTTAQN